MQTTLINNRHTDVGSTLQWIITGYRRRKTLSKPIMIRWVEAFTNYLTNCDYIKGSILSLKWYTYDVHTYGCSNQIHTWNHIISYKVMIMAVDNWTAKTYWIQFQAKETSNQSNCVVSNLSNDDLTLTKWSFSAPIHQRHSFARSLSPSPSLTSPQFNVNATQLNQSFNQIIHLFTNILI